MSGSVCRPGFASATTTSENFVGSWSRFCLIDTAAHTQSTQWHGSRTVIIGGNSVHPASVVRDLGVWIDRGLSMSTHVIKVVAGCFAVLRQLNSIRRSVSRESLIGLVVSLVLTRLDYCNAVLAGLPAYQLDRLQSAINAAARMIYRASRYDHVSSLLKELHWLRVPERIEFKLCALVYKCLNGNGPAYLAGSLQRVTDVQSRRRLRSSSSSTLIVPVTRRATLGHRAFPVVAARAWNALPDYVTSAPTYASFRTALKTFLFSRTFWHWQHASHWLWNVVLKRCCACTTLIWSCDDDDDNGSRYVTDPGPTRDSRAGPARFCPRGPRGARVGVPAG